MKQRENVQLDHLQKLPETLLSTHADSGKVTASSPPPKLRYDDLGLLGAGGMGEVRLCRDQVVGREVAIKVMKPSAKDASWRFLREARVQGQLEHPAIVPVYDMGAEPNGRPFFTMKRIRGASLADVIAQLESGDAQATKRWTLRRLLTLFAQVCTALEYAHARGVVHRDLKPANLMLGDFGEVYVLDWGLARILSDHDSAPDSGEISGDDIATAAGAMLGTPAYMAPEQLRADVGTVGPHTDVYALGLVLYEILTLVRVRSALSAPQRMVATLSEDGLSPVRDAPQRAVPPELDRLCHAATRLNPIDRIESARALGEAVDAYLDGDRDAALRAQMAEQHAERARHALARSKESNADEAGERTTAMREVTLALGLSPGHEEARRTLVTLLASPPQTIPPEAHARAKEHFVPQRLVLSRTALIYYILVWVWAPLPIWMGVRSWGAFSALAVSVGLCAVGTGLAIAMRVERRDRPPTWHLALTTLTVALTSTLFGALMWTPIIAFGNTLGYLSVYSRWRWVIVFVNVSAVVVPAVFGLFGLGPNAYDVHDGAFVIQPAMVSYPFEPTIAALLVTQIGILLVGAWLTGRVRDGYERAVTALEAQKWQLEQILPRT